MTVKIKVDWAKGADTSLGIPEYKSSGASGCDLRADTFLSFQEKSCLIGIGERKLINTGLIFEMPAGIEGQIRPRSGLALKFGIGLLNAPGTIDNDFRGAIRVLLINLGNAEYVLNHGDRIAQLIFSNIEIVKFEITDEMSVTERANKGFGSTG
tara:strand:- start:1651 stop:2112 length:462 start_codon:yes stop_codon:yes gene_type:complete